MDKTNYQAVIFDLDGVLTDTAHYHYLAWKSLAESLDIPFDSTFNEQLKGVGRMESLDLILARSRRSFTVEQRLTLAEEKNQRYLELIEGMSPDDLLPGTLVTLDAIRRADLMIGLGSASKNAFIVLERLGITDWFDYVVDAREIKNGKPAPDTFLNAAENLAVDPTRCLGVEDSVAGIRAIISAGMYALGIGDPAVLTEAHRVIPGLDHFDLSEYWSPNSNDCLLLL